MILNDVYAFHEKINALLSKLRICRLSEFLTQTI